MFAYCVGKLRLSEQAAFKRITAARLARRFPSIFAALAEGRLHLSGITLLAPHLTEDSAEGLLAAAEHKTKSEVETLLAERFPRPDLLAWVAPRPALSAGLTPLQVESTQDQLSPGRVETPFTPPPPGEPDSGQRCPERKGLQFDHELEVARGGEASASNIRLLCPAHNQHAAERTFGSEFMRHKRLAAAEARAASSCVRPPAP